MATRRYSVALGVGMSDDTVTEAVGLATVTASAELTVDFAVVTTKEDALLALEKLERYITQSIWPPA